MRKSFNQKIKKLSSSLIVVLLICMNFLIHLPFKAEAATTELKGLGDVSYYNAIIFGDHSATSADIEGAMAVQKNMNASSYTVVAAATGANNLAGATWVDEGYPSLLLGGQFTKAGAGQVIIQDGTVAMTKDGDPDGAMKTSYDRISYKEQAEIDAKFKEFRKDVDGVIGDASKLQTDKPKPNMSFGIGEDVNNPNIYVSSGQTGKKTFDVKDVFLPNVENKDFIVIYSDAEEVSFGGGAILYDTRNTGMATDLINTSQAYDPNSSFTELASKVIWVFPNATKITTKGYGVVGSVFAPNAVVETKGGSINGQAYVGGLHQRDGFEVHNFKFNWPKWNKPATEKGHLQIKKVDENDENIVLKDAKFDVIDKDGKVVETIVTDDKGEALSKQLPVGSYTLKEVEAPKGYELSSSSVSVDVEANKVVTVDVVNKKISEKVTGQFEIVKVDAKDKTKVLSDAEFEVYKDGKKVAELKTDESGKVMSPKLPLGEYTVKETKAPAGYKLSNKEWKVTIQNEKEVVKVEAENEKILGSLQIIKMDDKDQTKRLAGAKFTLKDAKGNVVKEGITTDKSGTVKVDGLVPGEYTLEETKAPEGYELTKQIIHVTVDGEKVVDVKVTNSKSLGQFEIVKVDAEDKTKVLSDAEFEVYKDGKKVDTLRTDKTGKVVSQKLEPGKYTLKETKAPQGYKLLKEEIEVVVEANKVVEVQVENVKELGSLQVIKKDSESGKVLAGAEFKLKNEAGQVVGEAKTTNKDGVVKFESLVPGKYTLEETKAPEGYKALEVTVEVNVVANEVVKQEVMNEKVKEEITGQLEITKVDANNTNKTLAGAVFEIWKDGTKIDTLTTNKSGKVTSKKLEPGDYTLKEIQAPEGYTLSDKEMKFTISNEKIEVVKLQITNKKDTEKGPEKPGEGTEKPGEGTEKPGEGTEKPGEGTEKPGEGTEKPGEGTEKPGEGTEKPDEGTEKPGEGTEKPGEGVEKPNLPEKGQGSSNNQQLPATGHNTNYVPFIGFMLLLLGIRLRFMAKNS
ncbi:SpaA isopeptide-forming pilin-related protein [Bacillus thuringiensis]|uniref:SpaA isopeptide-forming pilin-related protein n=1 Tax=Bacillus thuringiensis TaxID=1428 RepID=UPI003CF3E17C